MGPDHPLLLLLATLHSIQVEGNRDRGRCSGSAFHEVGAFVHRVLQDPEYDRDKLPNKDGVNVTLSFLVQEISSVSEITSDFEVDILYDEYWTDPRLAFPMTNLCRSNFSLKPEFLSPLLYLPLTVTRSLSFRTLLWRPETCVVNSKGAKIHASPSNNSFVILHNTGLLWASYRMKIKAPCRLDLTMFPFDVITCIIEFECYSLNAEEVMLNWDTVPIGFLSEVILPEFVLVGWKARKLQLPYPNGLWDRLEAKLVFSRLYGYYFVQVTPYWTPLCFTNEAYFPTFLTVCCSWLTFLLETRSVSARLSLSVSSLLALTFQLGTVTEELPRVSYLKCLDIWLFACILIIFLVNIEVAWVAYLSRHERARQVGSTMILHWLQHLRESREHEKAKELLEAETASPAEVKTASVRQRKSRPSAPTSPEVFSTATSPTAVLSEDGGTLSVGEMTESESLYSFLNVPLATIESFESGGTGVPNGGAPGLESKEEPESLRLRWGHVARVYQRFFATIWRPGGWWRALGRVQVTTEGVDNVSIVMFPASFAFFNLVYWTYYVYLILADTSFLGLVYV